MPVRAFVNFYPRSPCGERPEVGLANENNIAISIHALLAESDRAVVLDNFAPLRFLSTLSLRRATAASVVAALNKLISIHALLAESDVRPSQ